MDVKNWIYWKYKVETQGQQFFKNSSIRFSRYDDSKKNGMSYVTNVMMSLPVHEWKWPILYVTTVFSLFFLVSREQIIKKNEITPSGIFVKFIFFMVWVV